MSETTSRVSVLAQGSRPRAAGSPRPYRFRSRIGVGAAGGFYPAPHRYGLYLSAGCPRSASVSAVLELLGLTGSVAVTVLTDPVRTPDGFASLRGAYEATAHRYDGPLTVPALRDRWSGRIVSNHVPDILRDLAELASGQDGSAAPAPLGADPARAYGTEAV
ncbi:hypothetical protein AB0O07_04645 [Streptomyces sp. NPDC093085]|uniref:hypothetical protein n=1 Tax=Streptomyces sp. NPDC093085 TaxID=3155068 RepID=UPI00343C7BD2